jgi:AraC family transcriptional regulator
MILNGEAKISPQSWMSRMPARGQSIVASSVTVGWESVNAVILDGPIQEFAEFSAPFPIVMFVLKGAARLDWRRGNRYSRLGVKPGDVLIVPPGDGNRVRTNAAIQLLCCLIGRDRLEAIAAREWGPGPSPFEIAESFNRNDGELWNLGWRLADQLVAPMPGSRPYAEALQTQIAIHLLWNYSSLPHPANRADAPADSRLRQVIEYIEENLADDVSLDTLAGIAGLSPNYFLAAFRQATGRTPHRYVTELRVARACALLHDPRRPITDVSLAVGFSSQSHLTEVFRRTMKTTPAAYRREVLGLNREVDDGHP